METVLTELDLSPEWREALSAAASSRRAIILGPTDVGKTTFIRALLEGPGQGARLIDLDPGQKMIGAPGTAARGTLERMERFIFLGTTSASALSAIAGAAGALAAGAEPFIVNTSGFVAGIGARLQAMTVASIDPDLIVEIGAAGVVPPRPGARTIRLAASPLARRKSPAFRARLRQAAFDRALEGASLLRFARADIELTPGALAPWERKGRPVCALADGGGVDRAIGIVEAVDERTIFVRAAARDEAVRLIRLGKMWAEPGADGWRLAARLSPSWT